ncbi:MAG TPA: CDP-diacylglycerol diphosphatase [Roseiarcus sp.]|jgi:CDP-diacylglycerol pyrophosphatase
MRGWNSGAHTLISIFAFVALLAEPAHADRMALWKIVSLECVPHFEKGEAPVPCEHIDITGGEDRGYVDLKDLRGVAQMLTIPIRRVTGIEDPALLEPDAPNYFAGAWGARAYVEGHLHRSLPREAVAISVNSMDRRSQDQLHLHVDCVDKDVAATLAEYKDRFDAQWRPMSVALEGRHYWARRLDSPDLADISPFRLLADGVDGAKDHMGLWTLVAIGTTFSGQPGFILLADDAETGGGHGEDLQDKECAIATVK